MGIREKLNENPAITTGVTAGIIVIAIIVIIWQLASNSGGPSIPTQAWFSADDGQTYKAHDIKLLPPFDKDGKTWVRAVVFKCKDGKPFVAYLERYTPKAKAAMEHAMEAITKGEPPSMEYEQAQTMGLEVKKPGTPASGWISVTNYQKSAEVTQIKCPDGSTEGLEPVMP